MSRLRSSTVIPERGCGPRCRDDFPLPLTMALARAQILNLPCMNSTLEVRRVLPAWQAAQMDAAEASLYVTAPSADGAAAPSCDDDHFSVRD